MAKESNYAKSYEAKPDEVAAAKGKAKAGEKGASKAKASGRSAAQAKVKPAGGAQGAKPAASRKGLIVGVIALVAVIVVAAVAYNVLAPGAAPESLQTTGATTEREGGGEAASSGGDSGTTDGSEADGREAGAGNEGKSDAPAFDMTTPEGATVSLADLKGRPIVLNFWASTCGPCKMEMPEFQAAFEQYGDRLQFVMVNVPDFNGETRERALQLVADSGYTFPVYFDDTMQGQVLYGITSIPQTYFINADGTVEAYASGAIDASVLERGIEMVLAG